MCVFDIQKLDVNRDGLVTMETFLQVCLQVSK